MKFYSSIGRALNRCSSSTGKTQRVVIIHSRNRLVYDAQIHHLFNLKLLWIHVGLVGTHFIHENCPEDKECRKERVIKSYGHQSQYDYYEYDTYHANYNIDMEDDTMYRGQKQGDNQHFSFDKKYDKLVSMIETNKEANRRYEASFAPHDASFVALESHVDRLLEQLNKDETYEPQGITMLDFDDEDEDEDDHNNLVEDLISPIKEHDKELVPFKVGEEVMEANTTPYLLTLEEPILSTIDDIRSKEDEEFLALSLYEDKCSNLLEEAEVTHIYLNPPQLPRIVINQVGVDDSVFENEKKQDNVSLVKDEHHVVERCHENSFSKLTHIIVKKVHRKARILEISLWMTYWSKLEDPAMIIRLHIKWR
nr:hypothetical protein [Tanacetum cinerariifolium]